MHHSTSKCWVLQGFLEQDLLSFSLRNHSLGCISNTTSVMLCCNCSREDVSLRIHWFCKDFVPFSESNHDVPWHSHVGFKEDCSHWNNTSEHELNSTVLVTGRQGLNSLSCVFEGGLVLTIKHSTPDYKVVVVHTVELVELGFISSQLNVTIVCFNSSDVALDGLFPLSDPCIDMRRHVDQMSKPRHASS